MEGDTGGKGLVDNPFAFCHQLRGEPAGTKKSLVKPIRVNVRTDQVWVFGNGSKQRPNCACFKCGWVHRLLFLGARYGKPPGRSNRLLWEAQ